MQYYAYCCCWVFSHDLEKVIIIWYMGELFFNKWNHFLIDRFCSHSSVQKQKLFKLGIHLGIWYNYIISLEIWHCQGDCQSMRPHQKTTLRFPSWSTQKISLLFINIVYHCYISLLFITVINIILLIYHCCLSMLFIIIIYHCYSSLLFIIVILLSLLFIIDVNHCYSSVLFVFFIYHCYLLLLFIIIITS